MKIVSKLALAITLMLGNIEYNTPQADFYEDDSDFLQASSVLETGWGWSLNKAIANGDCSEMEGSEARECQEEGEEEGDGEVIEVIGSYDDDQSSYYYGGGDQSSYAEPGGGDDNGGGGSTDERLEQIEKEQQEMKERLCVAESTTLLNKCLADGADELTFAATACGVVATATGAFVVPWAGVAVAAACFVGYMYDREVINDGCEAEFISSTDSCS